MKKRMAAMKKRRMTLGMKFRPIMVATSDLITLIWLGLIQLLFHFFVCFGLGKVGWNKI